MVNEHEFDDYTFQFSIKELILVKSNKISRWLTLPDCLFNAHFIQVTTQCPEDIEAWIELGGILQNSDVTEALNAYNTAAQIIRDNVHVDVPPEILNNIASCLFQLGKYEVSY